MSNDLVPTARPSSALSLSYVEVDVLTLIEQYVVLLQAKEDAYRDAMHAAREQGYEYWARLGPKYTKIINSRVGQPTGDSAHSFVENATGYVFKSAGWQGPVKNGYAYDLHTDLPLLTSLPFMEVITTGYLYKVAAAANRARYASQRADR